MSIDQMGITADTEKNMMQKRILTFSIGDEKSDVQIRGVIRWTG